jgi:hypothetical protein
MQARSRSAPSPGSPATAPVSASSQRRSGKWWSISKDTCIGCRRRTLIVAGRQAVSELTRRPETVGDAGSGQLGDGAQCRETEAGEQAHQLGVDLARLVQPGDRLSGENAR